MSRISLQELVDLTFEVESEDPIDWGKLEGAKENVVTMLAASVLEQFDGEVVGDAEKLAMLATITKLIAENMALHTQLLGYQQ